MRHRHHWPLWLLLLLAQCGHVRAADPLCAGVEPKDVACLISHARNPEPADNIRYEWREAGLPADVFCGVRTTRAALRSGRPTLPALTSWNPYQWSGRCFPVLGETRTYRVRACWISTGLCSGWSAPLDVIGSEIQCCAASGCAPC